MAEGEPGAVVVTSGKTKTRAQRNAEGHRAIQVWLDPEDQKALATVEAAEQCKGATAIRATIHRQAEAIGWARAKPVAIEHEPEPDPPPDPVATFFERRDLLPPPPRRVRA
jgi:hypothetical protein